MLSVDAGMTAQDQDEYRELAKEAAADQVPAALTDRKGQLTSWATVREFLFGGSARFTLRSLKTGMRYTYRVAVSKKHLKDATKKDDPAYFVSLLRGADNERDYKYIGVMHGTRFSITTASRLPRTSPSVVALIWFLDAMEKQKDVLADRLSALDGGTSSGVAAKIEFWHEGRCACCGRVLTVPESIASGWGPTCRRGTARNSATIKSEERTL